MPTSTTHVSSPKLQITSNLPVIPFPEQPVVFLKPKRWHVCTASVYPRKTPRGHWGSQAQAAALPPWACGQGVPLCFSVSLAALSGMGDP